MNNMCKSILYVTSFLLASTLYAGSEPGPDQKQQAISWVLSYSPDLGRSSPTPGAFYAGIPETLLPKLVELLAKSTREVPPPSAPLTPDRSYKVSGIGNDLLRYKDGRVDIVDVCLYVDASKPVNASRLRRTLVVLYDLSNKSAEKTYFVENDALVAYVQGELRQKVLLGSPDARKRYGLDEDRVPLRWAGKVMLDANGDLVPIPRPGNVAPDRSPVPDRPEVHGAKDKDAHNADQAVPEGPQAPAREETTPPARPQADGMSKEAVPAAAREPANARWSSAYSWALGIGLLIVCCLVAAALVKARRQGRADI
jgi:hypothetical protein